MPKGEKSKMKKSGADVPYVVKKQDLPWHKPYEEVHYGVSAKESMFADLFTFEMFEIVSETSGIPNNPCTVFYNCKVLKDIKNRENGIIKKDAEYVKVEFRGHFGLVFYERGKMFMHPGATIHMMFGETLIWEILGGGEHRLGWIGGKIRCTKKQWIIPLRRDKGKHAEIEGAKDGKHTLIVHFPSLDFEVFGKRHKPTVVIAD